MNINVRFSCLVLLAALLTGACNVEEPAEEVSLPTVGPELSSSACALPTQRAGSPAETAWQIFVAAVCPTGKPATQPQLAFETWTEQSCIATPCTAENGVVARKPHGSPLLAANLAASSADDSLPPISGDCHPMVTKNGQAPASLKAFAPTNLTADAKFCEEVFVNDDELSYIKQPAAGFSLTTHVEQANYINAGHFIDFPETAVEVKVDWLPASSLEEPSQIDCDNPNSSFYAEWFPGENGTKECYAMASIHFSSKLYNRWLWATFEPQSAITNPNRCRVELYGECNDPWGATPNINGNGTETQLNLAVVKLMSEAKLPEAFKNYRLTGVQTNFRDGATVQTTQGTTVQYNLGSSFTEFNALVEPGTASCISCHNTAQIQAKATPPTEHSVDAVVGPSQPAQPPYYSQDFSWLLGVVLR